MDGWTPALVRRLLLAAGEIERRLPGGLLRPAGIRGGYPPALADLAQDIDGRIRRSRVPSGWPEPIYGTEPEEAPAPGRARPPTPSAAEITMLELTDALIRGLQGVVDRVAVSGLRAGVPARTVGIAIGRISVSGAPVCGKTVMRYQTRACALLCARLARTPVPALLRGAVFSGSGRMGARSSGGGRAGTGRSAPAGSAGGREKRP